MMTGCRWVAVIRGDVITLVEHKVCAGRCSGMDRVGWAEGCEALADGNWLEEVVELL